MQLKPIQMVHVAFCTSIVLFTGAAIFINKELLFFGVNLGNENPFHIIAPIFAVAALVIGPFLFEKIINKIEENSRPNEKFMKYQSAFIMKCAFFEGGAILNVILLLITSNLFFLLFIAACLSALLLSKPTKEKIYTTLQLQNTDPLDGI